MRERRPWNESGPDVRNYQPSLSMMLGFVASVVVTLGRCRRRMAREISRQRQLDAVVE